MSAGAILVFGEALADLVPEDAAGERYRALPGGSGFNTALALARCGARVAFCATLSRDATGRRFRERLAAEGIDLAFAGESDLPTPLAMVEPVGADGQAAYRFHLAGTALEEPPPAPRVFGGIDHVHLTSFGATVGASGEAALDLARRAKAAGRSLSYDLNIRPPALPPRSETRRLVEERVALCNLVKASVEDIAWLYDGDGDEALDRWLDLGAGLRILTHGAHGARVEWPSGSVMHGLARTVPVVDTIGAGDAFMAAFLASLARDKQLGPTCLGDPDIQAAEHALDAANALAAATCTVRGCDPPRLIPDQIDRRDVIPAKPR